MRYFHELLETRPVVVLLPLVVLFLIRPVASVEADAVTALQHTTRDSTLPASLAGFYALLVPQRASARPAMREMCIQLSQPAKICRFESHSFRHVGSPNIPDALLRSFELKTGRLACSLGSKARM